MHSPKGKSEEVIYTITASMESRQKSDWVASASSGISKISKKFTRIIALAISSVYRVAACPCIASPNPVLVLIC
jgi:hypothetical protein